MPEGIVETWKYVDGVRITRTQAFDPHFIKLLDTIPAYVFLAQDTECRSIVGNRATFDLLRVQPNGNVSKTALEDERPRAFEVFTNGVAAVPENLPMQRAARGEFPGPTVCELRFTDGEVVWISGVAHPLYDENGNVWGAIGTFIDISERKRAENILRQAIAEAEAARAEAEAANRAKSTFLATASHDLRQPMQALVMCHEALSTAVPEHARRAMDRARSCAAVMNQQLTELFDLARFDSGVMPVNIQRSMIDAIIGQVLNTVTPLAEAKGLEVQYVPCGCWVQTDAALLERLLANIIFNAVKYTCTGHVLVSCRTVKRTKLRVTVVDTGPGIPKDALSQIFDAYFRVEGTAESGTGLGLAIVDRIARRLAVPVTVRSKVRTGTAFTIELPLASPCES